MQWAASASRARALHVRGKWGRGGESTTKPLHWGRGSGCPPFCGRTGKVNQRSALVAEPTLIRPSITVNRGAREALESAHSGSRLGRIHHENSQQRKRLETCLGRLRPLGGCSAYWVRSVAVRRTAFGREQSRESSVTRMWVMSQSHLGNEIIAG